MLVQAIRRIVKRDSIKCVSVPEEFGDPVEIIVLSLAEQDDLQQDHVDFLGESYPDAVAEDNNEDAV